MWLVDQWNAVSRKGANWVSLPTSVTNVFSACRGHKAVSALLWSYKQLQAKLSQCHCHHCVAAGAIIVFKNWPRKCCKYVKWQPEQWTRVMEHYVVKVAGTWKLKVLEGYVGRHQWWTMSSCLCKFAGECLHAALCFCLFVCGHGQCAFGLAVNSVGFSRHTFAIFPDESGVVLWSACV